MATLNARNAIRAAGTNEEVLHSVSLNGTRSTTNMPNSMNLTVRVDTTRELTRDSSQNDVRFCVLSV